MLNLRSIDLNLLPVFEAAYQERSASRASIGNPPAAREHLRRDTALSLIFVLLTYVGPGMMKSVLTLRTGNAWVHAISYHAIAPHVIVDTPLAVKVFGIA